MIHKRAISPVQIQLSSVEICGWPACFLKNASRSSIVPNTPAARFRFRELEHAGRAIFEYADGIQYGTPTGYFPDTA